MNHKVIVSLTSFPPRIKYVSQTIKSLLNQTYEPYKILLYLSKEEFLNGIMDLPKELVDLQKTNDIFDIEWVSENLKSYKKLFYAANRFGEEYPIITVDDDINYSSEVIELLMSSYMKYPKDIHCHRAWKFIFDENKILVKENIIGDHWGEGSYLNMPTGVGGVLYPPSSYHEDFFKKELFLDLAPTADDLWFWCMAVLNDVKIRLVDYNIDYLNYIEDSQEGPSLFKINVFGEELNKVYIQKLLQHYEKLNNKLLLEFKMSKSQFQKYDVTNKISLVKRNLIDYLERNLIGNNSAKVIIWGTGERGLSLEKYLRENCIDVNFFMDSNFNKYCDEESNEISLIKLRDIPTDAIVLISTNYIFHNDIYIRLSKHGIKNIVCIVE